MTIDYSWTRIRPGLSWHIVSLASDRASRTKMLCGRRAGTLGNPAEIVDILPGGKSCNSCLRSAAKRADAPEAGVE